MTVVGLRLLRRGEAGLSRDKLFRIVRTSLGLRFLPWFELSAWTR